MGIEILRDHVHELAALASECGIDWHASVDSIRGPGKYQRPAVLNRKYRGKCVIFLTEFETRGGETCIRLTFSTQKHGGVNRTWTSRPTRNGAAQLSIASRQKSDTGDQNRRREEIFHNFKRAFAGAPQADAVHPY